MAATLLKQELFGSPEIKALANSMRWTEREALGCLAMLWNGSQNRKLSRVTPALILSWCQVPSGPEGDKFLAALIDPLVGYAKKTAKGNYKIVGNAKQISKLAAYKSASSLGGKATKAKWLGRNTEQSQTQDTEPKVVPVARPVATPAARLSSSLTSPSLTVHNITSPSPTSLVGAHARDTKDLAAPSGGSETDSKGLPAASPNEPAPQGGEEHQRINGLIRSIYQDMPALKSAGAS